MSDVLGVKGEPATAAGECAELVVSPTKT